MDERRHISYDNPYESTMNMRFIRKLPIPRDVKQEYPVPDQQPPCNRISHHG